MRLQLRDPDMAQVAPLHLRLAPYADLLTLRERTAPGIVSLMQSEQFNELYPGLPDQERKEAAENLDCYLLLAWEIYKEMQPPDDKL